MESDRSMSWINTAVRRSLLVAALLGLVSVFWAIVLTSPQLSTSFVIAVAALNVLLLSIAVAWAASALPTRANERTA